MFELIVKGEFSAAHNLRHYQGKCERLHGHNYQVELFCRQMKLNKLGMVIDFTVLKALMDEILNEYDHKYLNELKDFKALNPTAENIARAIHAKFQNQLPKSLKLKVCIWESAKTGASYSNAL